MRYNIIVAISFAGSSAAAGLVDALKAAPDLSTFVGAIQKVPGAAEALDGRSGITLFAPTNDAFAALKSDSLEAQAIANVDVQGIASILSYHVSSKRIRADGIPVKPVLVPTLLRPGNIFAGGPATLVATGQFLGLEKSDKDVVVTSGLLATSRVTEADIMVGGAVVHKIDSVLTIPRNASTTATAAGLKELVNALVAAGLAETVDSLPGITAFLPVDDAFKAIAPKVEKLTPAELKSVLTLHVVADTVLYTGNIPIGTTVLTTVNGEEVSVVKDENGTSVNGAKIVKKNVILRNGFGHVVDKVLIPKTLS